MILNHHCNRIRAWLSLVLLTVLSLPVFAQQPPPTPPDPPRAPRAPRPPIAPKVMTMGGPVSFLGIGVKEITGERVKELKLKEEAGIEVTRVDPGSPADQAGLKNGDAVLEYQGQRVEGTEQFVRLVRETPPGRNVKLKIVRNGSSQNLMATIAERKTWAMELGPAERARIERNAERDAERMQERLRNMPEIWMPDVPHPTMGWRSGMLGMEGEALNDQLAAFFGVKEGVLVRSVTKDMPAAKAGIKAGDVIIKLEDKAIRTPRDMTSAFNSSEKKNTSKITLVRQKSEMSVDVEVQRERPSRLRGRTAARSGENF